MRTRPNLRNFFYLLCSGLIIQFSGTIYRIWLARKIGASGLGIFQMIYPIYRLLSGIATIGLPLALTKWVSEYLARREYAPIDSLQKWAVRIALYFSLAGSLLLLVTASFVSNHLFTDSRVKPALVIIAIAIPFSALSAVYRGYFQGFSRMAPTACSEINEQIAEIAVTVTCFSLILPLGFLPVHAFPVIGLTAGEIICFLTLISFLKLRPRPGQSNQPIVAIPHFEIVSYSWPLMLNQIVVSLSQASEGMIVPRLLISAGYSTNSSTEWFGILNGMAAPIAFFPLIFLYPLVSVLSPQVSAAFASYNLTPLFKRLKRYYLLSLGICLTGLVFILSNTNFLLQLLYNNTLPATLTRLMVLGLPFTGISALNVNIFAAIGQTDRILKLSLCSVGLKTTLLVILTLLFGINGTAWAITLTQFFVCAMSSVQLKSFLAVNAL